MRLRSHSDAVKPSICDSLITASLINGVTRVHKSLSFELPSIFGMICCPRIEIGTSYLKIPYAEKVFVIHNGFGKLFIIS
jgi:hypothetical protein